MKELAIVLAYFGFVAVICFLCGFNRSTELGNIRKDGW
jgi:hypothetical protein